jgi:hypothetical protein
MGEVCSLHKILNETLKKRILNSNRGKLMKTLIDQNRFLQAVEFVDEHYFSKPYSLTPVVDRWFNQLAMIELENGTLVHVNGKIASKFMDFTLDNQVVTTKDLALVVKFHSQSSEFDKERISLEQQIKDLTLTLQSVAKNETNKKRTELDELNKKLQQFNANKSQAKIVYDGLVARGQCTLNKTALETEYASKIKRIIHRPNHGLTHSVRAAYYITAIQGFMQYHKIDYKILHEPELEKLQLMMLFSVVGRKDETGFNDKSGRKIYQSFRATSGKEYLNYCLKKSSHFYTNDLETRYRDAIVVELMGYANIDECIKKRSDFPELFIDYVIAKEHCLGRELTRETAIAQIINKTYTLELLFPTGEIRHLADAKLDMMNKAHALDLTRCYPLYPSSEGSAKSITVINNYLSQSGFYKSEQANASQLTSAYKILRCSFDAFALTGQSTTFGLIKPEAFESKKEAILTLVKEINAQFKPPISSERYQTLLTTAKANKKEIDTYWTLSDSNDSTVLDYYRKLLILKETVKQITTEEKLTHHQNMFKFQNSKIGNPHQVNYHKNAVRLINELQTVPPAPNVTQVELPIVLAVQHDRIKSLVTLSFEDKQQAKLFQTTYAALFGSTPPDPEYSTGSFKIEVDRKKYLQLRDDKLIEFKKVSIPNAISREHSLIDKHGVVEALNLISNSQALVRLVSTTALGGETFADYEYFLKALENPIGERYTPALKKYDHFPVVPGTYFDPRNAAIYNRLRDPEASLDLRFQEPVTTPRMLSDRLADGWVLGTPGRQKNTIFTKKLSHSLLPPHGKIIPYSGNPGKKSNYFPIGVLSDIRQVELKDERYIWSQNMDSFNKFWIRDWSILHKQIYNLFNAQVDGSETPIRDKNQVVLLEKTKIKKPATTDILIEYLTKKQQKRIELLDNRDYRPTNKAITDFKMLLRQEQKEYQEQIKGNLSAQKQIDELYKAVEERLTQEASRKHPKYSMTLQELIELQKKTEGVGKHNEILAGNTKRATRAFYASKDTLFDRLNLAFHAMLIKKKYHYDVPLLVLSDTNSPYHYTEALIRADLQNAYNLLQRQQFPFDTTLNQIYELGPDGNPRLDNGRRVPKKTADGRLLQEPKNLEYQKELLVSLFKIGMPKLTTLTQITEKKFEEKQVDAAIDSIVKQMDVIGGLSRETQLMNATISQADNEQLETLFLRQVALGHTALVNMILARDDFKLTMPVLEKAFKSAVDNKHYDVKNSEANDDISKIFALFASRGKEDTNTYLLLKEFKSDSLAQIYLDAPTKEQAQNVLQDTQNLGEIEQQCQSLIDEIEQQSYGNFDHTSRDYCETMRQEIELFKDNYLVLAMHLQKIKAVYQAITSPEMLAVKEQVERLDKAAVSFFGFGCQKKSNSIKEALSHVPLLERAHVFTNTTNTACTKVQIALASHRFSFINPVKADNTVDKEQAASSFKQIQAKLNC